MADKDEIWNGDTTFIPNAFVFNTIDSSNKAQVEICDSYDPEIYRKICDGEIQPLLKGISNEELARIHTAAARFPVISENQEESGLLLSDRIKAVAIPQFYLSVSKAIMGSEDKELIAAWESCDLHVGLFGSFAVAIATVNILSDMDVLLLMNETVPKNIRDKFYEIVKDICGPFANQDRVITGTDKEIKPIIYAKDQNNKCTLVTNPNNLGTVNELISWYQSSISSSVAGSKESLLLYPVSMIPIAQKAIEEVHKEFDFMNVKNEIIIALYNAFVYNHMSPLLSHASGEYALLKFTAGGYSTFRNIHVILRAIRSMQDGASPEEFNDWEEFRWPSFYHYLHQINVLEEDDLGLLKNAASSFGLYANKYAFLFGDAREFFEKEDAYRDILKVKFGLVEEEVNSIKIPSKVEFEVLVGKMKELNEKVITRFISVFEKYALEHKEEGLYEVIKQLKAVWGNVIVYDNRKTTDYNEQARQVLLKPIEDLFPKIKSLQTEDERYEYIKAKLTNNLTPNEKALLKRSYSGVYWLVCLGVSVSLKADPELLLMAQLIGNSVFDDDNHYIGRKAMSNVNLLYPAESFGDD